MAIDHDHLLNYPIPEIRQTIRWQDTALYNFSIGLGQDPMDQAQLDFLYEPRLKAMPSMAVVLGYPGFWIRNPDTGVDWAQVLHGEQSIILHKPLPAEGEIIGKSRITSIVDRGPGKGAMLYNERVVTDAKTRREARHAGRHHLRARRWRLRRAVRADQEAACRTGPRAGPDGGSARRGRSRRSSIG